MSLFLDELIFTLLRVLGSDFGIQNWYTGFKIALDTVLWEQKVNPPPLPVFPSNFCKRRISSQNILYFRFNPFATL